MTELLPCPFCKGKAHTYRTMAHRYCAICNKPYCASVGPFDTEAEAIEAWNTRAERTCKQEERGWGTEGDHARVWLTCGHDCIVPTVQDLPNYCPNCGARVVE